MKMKNMTFAAALFLLVQCNLAPLFGQFYGLETVAHYLQNVNYKKVIGYSLGIGATAVSVVGTEVGKDSRTGALGFALFELSCAWGIKNSNAGTISALAGWFCMMLNYKDLLHPIGSPTLLVERFFSLAHVAQGLYKVYTQGAAKVLLEHPEGSLRAASSVWGGWHRWWYQQELIKQTTLVDLKTLGASEIPNKSDSVAMLAHNIREFVENGRTPAINIPTLLAKSEVQSIIKNNRTHKSFDGKTIFEWLLGLKINNESAWCAIAVDMYGVIDDYKNEIHKQYGSRIFVKVAEFNRVVAMKCLIEKFMGIFDTVTFDFPKALPTLESLLEGALDSVFDKESHRAMTQCICECLIRMSDIRTLSWYKSGRYEKVQSITKEYSNQKKMLEMQKPWFKTRTQHMGQESITEFNQEMENKYSQEIIPECISYNFKYHCKPGQAIRLSDFKILEFDLSDRRSTSTLKECCLAAIMVFACRQLLSWHE